MECERDFFEDAAKLKPDLFSIKYIMDNFHVDINDIQPFDTLMTWDVIRIADYVVSKFPRGYVDMNNSALKLCSLLETINCIEAAVIFEHIVVPTRNVSEFNRPYSINGLTKCLADEGILRTTIVDNIYISHPDISNVQCDMVNTLFFDKIESSDAFIVSFGVTWSTLYWKLAIQNIYEYGYNWIKNESVESRGFDGEPGYVEDMFMTSIYISSIAKTLNTNYQSNIMQNPIHQLLLFNNQNYKLPDAYYQIIQKIRMEGFGNKGYRTNLIVPAIASYVFSGNLTINDIIKRLKKMRKKFHSFRQRFREYQYVLENEKEFDSDKLISHKTKYWNSFLKDIEAIGRSKGSFFTFFDPLSVKLSSKTEAGSYEVSLSIEELGKVLRRGFSLMSFSSNVKLMSNLYKSSLALPMNNIFMKRFPIHELRKVNDKFLKEYENYIINIHKQAGFIF